MLGTHLYAALCPLLTLALVQIHKAHLLSVMHDPDLLYLAALIMILGGIFEIAHNSFEHHGYTEDVTPGYFDTVFGTTACLAMATVIIACYGQYLLVVGIAYALALSYPVVFLALNSVLLTLYFFRLLRKTQAQAFHGFVAATSAPGMLVLPGAIHNSANNTPLAGCGAGPFEVDRFLCTHGKSHAPMA